MAVERKSYDDLYACLTNRLKPFTRQLKKLGKLKYRLLMIDSTCSAFLLGHVYYKLTGPEALVRLTRLCAQHDVPFCFCDRHGSELTAAVLHAWWKLEEKASQAVGA